MKKTIKTLLVFCMVFLGLVVLASCDQTGQGGGNTPACEHVAGGSWQVDATYHWHRCSKCDEIMDKAEHAFGEWEVRQEPAVGSEGSKVRICADCRYYEAESIPAIEVATGETTGDTVVFAKVPADWTAVNCYYWHNEAGTNNLPTENAVGWPGKPMTLVDEAENIYAFIVPVGTANVIFNNDGSVQTVDIPFALEQNLYVLSAEAGGDGKFTANVDVYEYEGSLDDIAKYPTNAPTTYKTIYVQFPAAYVAQNIHTWGSAGGTSWPGVQLDVVDAANRVYSYDLPSTITGFLFGEGDGLDQTANVTPNEEVNAYIINSLDGNDSVTPCTYADGVFTPVEVAEETPVFFVKGSMNGWSDNDSFKLAYDEASDTATITVTFAAGDEFKVATSSWDPQFNSATTTMDAACFGANGENISVITGGTYVITVTNVSTAERACTIVAA